jgi:Protein of unknown function (DUF4232)
VPAMSAHRRAVTVLCACIGIAVAGCASRAAPPQPAGTTNHGVDLAGAIPWIHAPTEPPLPPPPPPPRPRPTDAPPCRAGDVAASFDGSNGAGGHAIVYVTFRNITASTCVLKGYPQVTASQPGLPDLTGTDGSFFQSDGTANMAPGQNTLLGLETDTYCPARPGGGGGQPRYHHLAIVPPGGGTVSLDRADGFDTTCGLHLTKFFVPQPEQPQPPTPTSRLTSTLDTPSTVAAGATLIYVVALTNPTATAVTLSPCPPYLQAAPSIPVKDIEALHCRPVGAITAHGTVRFEMHMQIPADTTVGELKIIWQLVGPEASPEASALIDVTPTPQATRS